MSPCARNPSVHPPTPRHRRPTSDKGDFSKRMNYRSVKTLAVSRWGLLNLTAFTASSHAPTFHRRESNRVFAVEPDDLELRRGRLHGSPRLSPSGHVEMVASKRKLCRTGQESVAFSAEMLVTRTLPLRSTDSLFFFLCFKVSKLRCILLQRVLLCATLSCQNQPQEGGIPAPGSHRSCRCSLC